MPEPLSDAALDRLAAHPPRVSCPAWCERSGEHSWDLEGPAAVVWHQVTEQPPGVTVRDEDGWVEVVGVRRDEAAGEAGRVVAGSPMVALSVVDVHSRVDGVGSLRLGLRAGSGPRGVPDDAGGPPGWLGAW